MTTTQERPLEETVMEFGEAEIRKMFEAYLAGYNRLDAKSLVALNGAPR